MSVVIGRSQICRKRTANLLDILPHLKKQKNKIVNDRLVQILSQICSTLSATFQLKLIFVTQAMLCFIRCHFMNILREPPLSIIHPRGIMVCIHAYFVSSPDLSYSLR